ncbi:flavin monoamine oxidase family protein [Nocardia fluminea]|uniref:flavin monoamine oxidase family protein n=1 Tax=Nocardia fluminea TaxID=134984 RepID=UPI003668729A
MEDIVNSRVVDVAVVGAGLAGLSAAREARRRGLSVTVLEARDRVGGKTLAALLPDGSVIEVGGQYIGPGQTMMYRLAEEFGLETYRAHPHTGDALAESGGQVFRIPAEAVGVTSFSEEEQRDLEQVVAKFENLVALVDPGKPWDAINADELDRTTLDEWVNANTTTSAAHGFLCMAIATNYSCDAWDISLLHSLIMLASEGGSVMEMIKYDDGPQQDRILGGSQLVAERMAAELGDDVVLNAPVRRIEQDAEGVVVYCDDVTVSAGHVVVAVPPALASRIRYTPDLSVGRELFTQRVANGHMTKLAVVYPRPFWRDDGLSGLYMSETSGFTAFDNTPTGTDLGVVGVFLPGRDAADYGYLSTEQRRATILGHLTTALGAAAAEPIDFIELDWAAQTWSRGGHNIVAGPGTWTKFGRHIRQPEGRIHWAGSESSTEWLGYMEGALRSGIRALAEITSDHPSTNL